MRGGILAALGGMLGGLLMTVVILTAARWALNALEGDRTFAIEHGTVYLCLVLGAGFGALTGVTLAGRKESS